MTSLHIDGCNQFGGDLFEQISEMSRLTKLSIDLFQSDEFCLDLSLFQFLQELKHLEIRMVNTEQVPLAKFWSGLNGSTKLVLTVLDLGDEGFAGIHALLCLEELVVVQCPEVNSSTF